WVQTNWEIRCRVPVDPETTKGDIRCSIKPNQMSLAVFDEVILDGPLCDKIDIEESSWILERLGKELPPRLEIHITLKKERESQGRNHWNCVVQGEPTIDVDHLGPPIKVINPRDLDAMALLKSCNENKDLPFFNMRDLKANPG
ncbi:Nudcd2, partial [Symbiodinium sp. CCMP2456]